MNTAWIWIVCIVIVVTINAIVLISHIMVLHPKKDSCLAGQERWNLLQQEINTKFADLMKLTAGQIDRLGKQVVRITELIEKALAAADAREAAWGDKEEEDE